MCSDLEARSNIKAGPALSGGVVPETSRASFQPKLCSDFLTVALLYLFWAEGLCFYDTNHCCFKQCTFFWVVLSLFEIPYLCSGRMAFYSFWGAWIQCRQCHVLHFRKYITGTKFTVDCICQISDELCIWVLKSFFHSFQLRNFCVFSY